VVRGRVNKYEYVTSVSKTAVMNVIGFLYVSRGSSIVLFYDSLGSRRAYACSEAGFSSQNGDCFTDVSFVDGEETTTYQSFIQLFIVFIQNVSVRLGDRPLEIHDQ
jgi:hypothetical protein